MKCGIYVLPKKLNLAYILLNNILTITTLKDVYMLPNVIMISIKLINVF